jgi:outer membrane protein assembly factor BamB
MASGWIRGVGVAALLFGWILALAIPAAAQTQGWSQFQGGPGHRGWAPDGPEPPFHSAWTLPVAPGGPDGQYGLSAPVVAEDTVIVVGPEQVLGVDASTGTQSWTVERDLGPPVVPAVAEVDGATAVVFTEGFGAGPPSDASSSASAPGSPSASPSAGEAGEPFDSHLAAFDLATRKALWDPVQLDAVSRTGVVVDGSQAFVGVNGGIVEAVDLENGEIAWKADLGRVIGSPVAVEDGTVVVGLQADRDDPRPTVVALDASSGEQRWSLDDEGSAAIVSTPAIAQGRAYVEFSGGQESSVDAIDIDSGARRWRARFPRFFDLSAVAPPTVTDDAIYVTDAQGETSRLDAETGSVMWDFAENVGVIRAAPVVSGSFVLVGAVDGSLAALEASSGDLVWRDSSSSSPTRAIAVAGDLVLVVRAGSDAGLEAFAHDAQGNLIREVSPTRLDVPRLAGWFVIAAAVVVVIVLMLGRYLAPRMGPAFEGRGGDGPEEGIEDDAAGADERDEPEGS